MSKISYEEYVALMVDPDVDDDILLKYSNIVKGEGGFDWRLQPDPTKVEISEEDLEAEGALDIGNGFARWRRARKFNKRMKSKDGENLPVLVSEGDSWFQFPVLIKEVIDQLKDDYIIWSVGAAGDTADNMVFGPEKKGKTEYLRALRKQKEHVKGFLFSAAGNDIIGEDPETSTAALFDILKDFNGNNGDVHGHIDFAELGARLSFLQKAYQRVIANIRTEPGLEDLPILVHGYDYVFPFPFGSNDTRDPSYAARNEWLGEPLDKRGFPHELKDLRRNIIMVLIDALYDMLNGLAGDSQQTGVWVVDCRGAMPDLTDWKDEIHGTSEGFAKVASRFRAILEKAV